MASLIPRVFVALFVLSVAAAMWMSWRVTSEKPDKSGCSLSNSTLYTKSLTAIVVREETLVKVVGITCQLLEELSPCDTRSCTAVERAIYFVDDGEHMQRNA